MTTTSFHLILGLFKFHSCGFWSHSCRIWWIPVNYWRCLQEWEGHCKVLNIWLQYFFACCSCSLVHLIWKSRSFKSSHLSTTADMWWWIQYFESGEDDEQVSGCILYISVKPDLKWFFEDALEPRSSQVRMMIVHGCRNLRHPSSIID